MVKESPNAGTGKGQGSPMACPSCIRPPKVLRVVRSKNLPFQCFKIEDQLFQRKIKSKNIYLNVMEWIGSMAFDDT